MRGHDDEVAFVLSGDSEDFLVDLAVADAGTGFDAGRNVFAEESAEIFIGLCQRLGDADQGVVEAVMEKRFLNLIWETATVPVAKLWPLVDNENHFLMKLIL